MIARAPAIYGVKRLLRRRMQLISISQSSIRRRNLLRRQNRSSILQYGVQVYVTRGAKNLNRDGIRRTARLLGEIQVKSTGYAIKSMYFLYF